MWKKEYWLIVVVVLCIAIYYYGENINQNHKGVVEQLPILGGLAFGLNTLINLTK